MREEERKDVSAERGQPEMSYDRVVERFRVLFSLTNKWRLGQKYKSVGATGIDTEQAYESECAATTIF